MNQTYSIQYPNLSDVLLSQNIITYADTNLWNENRLSGINFRRVRFIK